MKVLIFGRHSSAGKSRYLVKSKRKFRAKGFKNQGVQGVGFLVGSKLAFVVAKMQLP